MTVGSCVGTGHNWLSWSCSYGVTLSFSFWKIRKGHLHEPLRPQSSDGKKDKDNVYLTVSVLPFHPHTLGPEGQRMFDVKVMKERKTSLKVKKHIMIEKTKHKRHEISIKDFFFHLYF